jgi:4-hydroxy-tetrahydrodipicolinate synthase
MDNKFARVYPAVVTPFHEDGSFDYEAARKHADWMIDNGLTGLALLCASGEYQSISNDEHMAYIREMVPYLKNRASIIVGVSRERPEDVVELMENARIFGADAAMVLPPFYYHLSQDELIAHYQYINSHSTLPIMVYNNPGTSVAIAPDTIDELCKLEHVKLIKETSGNIDVMTEYICRVPENIGIMCGCEYLLYAAYATGATGWISMIANFLPAESVAFHKTMYEEHDYAKGLEIYKSLRPALEVMEKFPKAVHAAKYILKEVVGIDVGYVRRPRQELSDEEKKYVLESTRIRDLIK